MLVYGDLNIDIIARVPEIELKDLFYPAKDLVVKHGGVGGNIAEALLVLGYHPIIVASVGEDCFGQDIISRLERLGVVTDWVRTVQGESTGLIIALVTIGGGRTLTGGRNANSFNTINGHEASNLLEETRPDHVHVSGYTIYNRDRGRSIISLLTEAKSRDITTSIDLEGIAMSEPQFISDLAGLVDVVLLNNEELNLIYKEGSIDHSLKKIGSVTKSRWVIVKQGEKGSSGWDGEKIVQSPSFRINPIDTTGAGDAFNAGVIAGFLKGLNLEQTLTLANLMGAYSCMKIGARIGGAPVEELLEIYTKTRGPLPVWLREFFQS